MNCTNLNCRTNTQQVNHDLCLECRKFPRERAKGEPMPYGKPKGFCNQGSELLRVNEENAALKASIAELQAGRADLISIIETMNQENAQLSHRLWLSRKPRMILSRFKHP